MSSLRLSSIRLSSLKRWRFDHWSKAAASVCASLLICATVEARADLPGWMQHVLGASTFEAALYRAFDLPGVKVLYPRPPKEAQAELQRLTQADAKAELYTLKALTDEQALDFGAAEADWKTYVAKAADTGAARLRLADYYHRRLQIQDEAKTLAEAANAPPAAGERFTPPVRQRSWTTYERLLRLLDEQGPDRNPAAIAEVYKQWIMRYPLQTTLYGRLLRVQLERRDYAAAESVIAQYRQARADDAVFPIKATALVEYTRGSQQKALEVYDRSFQPLWPQELVESYLSLLEATRQKRAFVADARARLVRNPDDLNALARIVVANRAQGQAEIDAWREGKDARRSPWSAEELYTLARLCGDGQNVPEAARFYFALASAQGNLTGGESAAQAGTAALIHLLLSAPEQPIALGGGNLSMYRDIATLDHGPGYWNGVLSLWLNGATPDSSFHDEELKAQPYFHRTKAAELLAQFDKQFPNAPQRAGLHAELLHVYANYGETALTIAAAKEFLSAFPKAEERTEVSGLLADAYARNKDTASEFALYDAMLAELGAKTAGMPLSSAQPAAAAPEEYTAPAATEAATTTKQAAPPAFELSGIVPDGLPVSLPAVEYGQTLERYIGRLTAQGNLPKALEVLRAQLDRNPGDPLIYERLAAFLQQNNLYAQQDAVYKLAIDKFQDAGWYDKLARLYLREKKREAFADITRQVTRTFEGTEVDRFFSQVGQGGPDLFLQLNLYAAERFPHDLTFTRNLLAAYTSKQTGNAAAWEKLLRQHWMDAEDLRAEFFEYLSRTNKLDAEVAQLRQLAPAQTPEANPAAARELAEAYLQSSHFEQSAPLLGSLAALYPADATIGNRAASVFRSLAYYDPSATGRAVAIETNLLQANPGDTTLLATLGDLHAEQKDGGATDLAAAAPYWRRIPAVHAGSPEGYLEAATIFWDYFQFDDALAQIAAARTRFHNPALYGYEAGAIDEGRREMPAAIAEYTAAALASDEPAHARLLTLARRKSTRPLVDAATAAALAAHRDATALSLRADVLAAQRRDAELPALFDQAIAHATTAAQVEELATLAQSHALTPVYEHALARQAELATDGVQSIELQYTLARSYESRHDVKSATLVIDKVYRANPKILGVVRATTDFYDRTEQPKQAIATLLEAAKAANPEFAAQFTLEAADKANTAGDTAQARTLATGLLAQEPYNPRYLAVMATSYARAGDDAGLRAFYAAKLDAIKTAPIGRDERRQTMVILRRGLIPALTRLKDYAGALDQYIAIISAYPEDSGTTQVAALYALRYSRQQQLLDFLRTTLKASPRDSRFAILLAQVETTFEDLPAAVTAYSQAIAIRKDRVDLYTARADLLVRLTRLDEAAEDYQRLYLLTYKDPAWMVRLAELRARQQRPADAVKALETAWITGRPVAAANSFTVAAQLEQWNLLKEARTYAELGASQAGDDLLLGANAATYARILTRAGLADKALRTLLAAYHAADTSALSPAVLTAQAEKEGVASVTDAEWRRNFVQSRHAQLDTQLRQGVDAIGAVVQTYFTPEQKLAYAQTLDGLRATPAPGVDGQFLIGAAASAGLRDREADWRKQALMASASGSHNLVNLQPYTELQRSRLQFAALAQTLEALVATRPSVEKNAMRQTAAEAYRDAGDAGAELRLDRALVQNGDPNARERYFRLLLQRSPASLTATAGGKYGELADAAANYALAHGTDAAAQAAVAARAANLPALWRSATTSLLGLYLVDSTPAVNAAFTQSLADRSIGERLATPVDAKTNLTGRTWYYYAGRYGAYRMAVTSAGDAEDFLPASLERNPESARGYAALGRTYVEAGKLDAGLGEFGHALELDADQPLMHDEMAAALWRAGRKDEAMAQWRQAYGSLLAVENKAAPPASFWSQFGNITANVGRRGLAAKLRPEIDAVMTPYLSRNGSYRSNELLRAIYEASATPAEGTAWIAALAVASKDPAGILNDLALYNQVHWLAPQSAETLLMRLIELTRSLPAASEGGSRADDVAMIQRKLMALYLEQNELAKAAALLDTVSPEKVKTYDFDQSRIVLAARSGRLPALLDAWRAQPESAPEEPVFNGALRQLQRVTPAYTPDAAVLRTLEEFLFARKQLANSLAATDFLALAEARLKTGDLPGALDLLHRLALRPADGADPYANLDSAAALLESSQQPAAAIPFLATLSRSVPWNASLRSRLALAQLAAGQDRAQAQAALLAVAASSDAPYALRLAAAKALPSVQTASLGSKELELLAGRSHSADAARQPYFAAARFAAAADPANREQEAALLREAIAIDPASPAAAPAHLRLFVVEAEAGQTQAALAVFASLQTMRSPTQASTPSGADEASADADGAAEEPEVSGEPGVAELPPLAADEPLAARIHLAELLAKVQEDAGEPGFALEYLQAALRLEPDAARKAELRRRFDALNAETVLEQRNATRRPTIHAALDQANLVRPRLTLADLAREAAAGIKEAP
ncbi:hypothetical protein SAMN05421770_105203 [Granulicella rosea]|uniref:Tetratricopeptide repeat-containing protein n=1 Tax=Granulicella rosea TaxID=474952 RepID=A0A239KT22_9BACT|nr:hypothetical protein [Granulicella rosea]SNT21496.1 hypothetical protein SAMN05421770_105203 [Granulicella rosea]